MGVFHQSPPLSLPVWYSGEFQLSVISEKDEVLSIQEICCSTETNYKPL